MVSKVNIGTLVSLAKLPFPVTIGNEPKGSLLTVQGSDSVHVCIAPASHASVIGREGGIAKPDFDFVGVGRERNVVEGAMVCVSVTMTVFVCLTNEECVERLGLGVLGVDVMVL